MSESGVVSYRIQRCRSDGKWYLNCDFSNTCNLRGLLVPAVQLGFDGYLAVKMAVEVPVENGGRNKHERT